MKLNNILIASDFSKHAEWALQRTLDLAKPHNTKVHFIHVITPPLSSIVTFSDTEQNPDFFSEKKDLEDKILNKLKENHYDSFANISVILGRPSDEVVRYAEEHDCELIVLGAHGAYYINDYVLGTTSGSIIRQSHTPVLLVKKEPDFTYNKILIATDLSESNKDMVRMAFQCFPNATFQLLYIVDIYYRQLEASRHPDSTLTNTPHPKMQAIIEKLELFLDECDVDKSKFTKKVIGGYYADAIIEQANNWNADLLIFGTQGKSGLHYLLMGSVAKRIIYLSSVDMLVFSPRNQVS
ncbi:universal stress protein [Legionella worsleiensis]|uniref:Universal stress family protein n=1 Tax=Legionella worsleiensis TaxID=45076 RepID=A0A0W1A6A7_9GAMM|nr:universal stress protein [Legionella worsleiensis]KTD76898.1 universal stress family protein [Legionella worsleiensis]STY33432.1 Universal stress protein A [Legionella worsleiensis]